MTAAFDLLAAWNRRAPAALVQPVGYLRNEESGKAIYDPIFLCGAHAPGAGLYGATYRPVFDAPPAAAPVQMPEPAGSTYTMEALVPGGRKVCHVTLHQSLPAGTNLYTEAQVRALLASARAVPQGWQMVPVEPTEEQLAALRQKQSHPTRPDRWDGNHRRIYQHMLAAAPKEPGVSGALPVKSPSCWCATCDTATSPFGIPTRMNLCPRCGDKRCPRAQHHDSDCFAAPKEPAP